jgi:hypothetical protein
MRGRSHVFHVFVFQVTLPFLFLVSLSQFSKMTEPANDDTLAMDEEQNLLEHAEVDSAKAVSSLISSKFLANRTSAAAGKTTKDKTIVLTIAKVDGRNTCIFAFGPATFDCMLAISLGIFDRQDVLWGGRFRLTCPKDFVYVSTVFHGFLFSIVICF